ncbi:MAG: hypothetical protein KF744_16980 [Taibaiella sp.]|nr:hypothetical protein [Taibaiella sp.]
MNTRIVLSITLALVMMMGAISEASAKGGPGCRPRVVVRITPPPPRYCAPAPVVVYRRPACRRPVMRHRYYSYNYHNGHNNHYYHHNPNTGHGYYHHR